MQAFNQGKNFDFPQKTFQNVVLTLNFKKNYKISDECYCGNTYGSYGTASSQGITCDKPCPNKQNEICGGGNANSIYSLNCTNEFSSTEASTTTTTTITGNTK